MKSCVCLRVRVCVSVCVNFHSSRTAKYRGAHSLTYHRLVGSQVACVCACACVRACVRARARDLALPGAYVCACRHCTLDHSHTH